MQNETVKSDLTVTKSRLERTNIEFEMKVQDLEDKLQNKDNELENKTRNLMVRLNSTESANRQQGQEKNEAEKQLREEREKYRQLTRNLDSVERIKNDLEQKLRQISNSERLLRQHKTSLTVENDELKTDLKELQESMAAKEKEWSGKLEGEGKAAEARMKQRLEKTWLEKLRRSEASAAQEVSI